MVGFGNLLEAIRNYFSDNEVEQKIVAVDPATLLKDFCFDENLIVDVDTPLIIDTNIKVELDMDSPVLSQIVLCEPEIELIS